jgi:hypothetical protein
MSFEESLIANARNNIAALTTELERTGSARTRLDSASTALERVAQTLSTSVNESAALNTALREAGRAVSDAARSVSALEPIAIVRRLDRVEAQFVAAMERQEKLVLTVARDVQDLTKLIDARSSAIERRLDTLAGTLASLEGEATRQAGVATKFASQQTVIVGFSLLAILTVMGMLVG